MNILYEGLKEKGALMLVPSTAVESMGLGGLMGAAALRQQTLSEPTREPELRRSRRRGLSPERAGRRRARASAGLRKVAS